MQMKEEQNAPQNTVRGVHMDGKRANSIQMLSFSKCNIHFRRLVIINVELCESFWLWNLACRLNVKNYITYTRIVLSTSHEPLLLFDTPNKSKWFVGMRMLTLIVSFTFWWFWTDYTSESITHGIATVIFCSSVRMQSEVYEQSIVCTMHICDWIVCARVCVYNNYTVLHSVSISTNISRAMIFFCICKHFPWIPLCSLHTNAPIEHGGKR